MSSPHTPLPWRVFGIKNADTGEHFYVACSPSDKPGALASGLSKENAELIVRAVNSHAVLEGIVRDIVSDCEGVINPSLMAIARAALAQLDKPE